MLSTTVHLLFKWRGNRLLDRQRIRTGIGSPNVNWEARYRGLGYGSLASTQGYNHGEDAFTMATIGRQ